MLNLIPPTWFNMFVINMIVCQMDVAVSLYYKPSCFLYVPLLICIMCHCSAFMLPSEIASQNIPTYPGSACPEYWVRVRGCCCLGMLLKSYTACFLFDDFGYSNNRPQVFFQKNNHEILCLLSLVSICWSFRTMSTAVPEREEEVFFFTKVTSTRKRPTSLFLDARHVGSFAKWDKEARCFSVRNVLIVVFMYFVRCVQDVWFYEFKYILFVDICSFCWCSTV